MNVTAEISLADKRGAMEVRVEQTEGVRFSVKSRTHELVSDQPIENGGQDTGMTPPELLLGALGIMRSLLCGGISAHAQIGRDRSEGKCDGR